MTKAKPHRKVRWIIPLFLIPSFVVYSIFFVYPAIDAFRIAAYEWSGFGENAKFVGFRNFTEALRDRLLRVSITNNFIIMLVGGSVLFILAMYFAVILTTPNVKGKRLLRTVLFFPYSVNVVGVAFLWLFALNPQFGAVNGALEALGLGNLTQVWFGSRKMAIACIIWIIIWMVIGFYTILLQSGIDNIPQELLDAASVDGAQGFTLFWRITLPLLRDVLAVAVTYWMIQALKIFGIIYATTRGAPASETHSVATYMFEIAMPYQEAVYRFGYGTAIAVLQFILIVAMSALFFRFTRREAVEF